jgi:hypothetical protein
VVGRGVVTATRRERPGQHAGVGKRDDRDTCRTGEQGAQIAETYVRHGEAGQALGQLADEREVVGTEAEHGGKPDAGRYRQQHGRNTRRDAPSDQDEAERTDAERQRGAVRLPVGQAAHQFTHTVYEAVGVGGEAAQFGELADEDEQGNAVEVAVANRQRQQVGQVAEPSEAGSDAQQPGQDGQGRGQHRGSRRIGSGERKHGRGDQRGQRGVRSENDDP